MGRGLVVVVLLGAGACLDPAGPGIAERDCSPIFYDSLGAPFPRIDGSCRPTVGEDSPTGDCATGEPSVIFGWGRFYEACPGCGNATTPDQCRPLVCEADEDCPVFANKRLVDGEVQTYTETFECRQGLCQNADLERFPEDAVDPEDASLLCLANLDRGEVYDGPDVCAEQAPSGQPTCTLPLPDVCLQP